MSLFLVLKSWISNSFDMRVLEAGVAVQRHSIRPIRKADVTSRLGASFTCSEDFDILSQYAHHAFR